MEVREDHEEVNPKDFYNLNQGDGCELRKAGVMQKPQKGPDTGAEPTDWGDWGAREALNSILNVPGLRLQSDILRSLADCGNRALAHGTFRPCLEAQVENCNYSGPLNQALPEDAGQTNLSEDAGTRQGAGRGEGAMHLACAIPRLYLSDH